jgi:hypothetical protein
LRLTKRSTRAAGWAVFEAKLLAAAGLPPTFYCFGDISIGSRVIVRSHATEHPDWVRVGAIATVANIISSDDGSLFHLQFDDGRDDYSVRAEIRKPRYDE